MDERLMHERLDVAEDLDLSVVKDMREYYTEYYRDTLGLGDWQRRVKVRLDEERIIAEPMIQKIEQWFTYDFAGKRVLVVGAGTGAEVLALARRGASVVGVDANEKAVRIFHRRALRAPLHPRALTATAEALPFASDRFDFVYCYTVLEHVENVPLTIDEMVRVCRVGGHVFIHTPNYRFPFESHYKLPLVPFAPRWIQALYLRCRGRSPRFLKSINLVTERQLNRLLWQRNVTTYRVWEPEPMWWRHQGQRWQSWFAITFAAQKQQCILLTKRPVSPTEAASVSSV